MKRLMTLAMVLFALSLLVAPAAARQHDNGDDGPMNKKKCEEAGGVWHNERGIKYCATLNEDASELDPATEPEERFGVFDIQLQRGNVDARGTSDTQDSGRHQIFFETLCEALGPSDLIPPSVCAILYKLVFPDD